jgi:predicted amidohydrolase
MPFDGTQVNETAAHLMRAKRYIEEHGWCPLGVRDNIGRVCVVAALNVGVDYDAMQPALRRLCEAAGEDDLFHLARWNDTPGRTVEEVYAAFDRAIALAMERTAP